MNFKFVYFWDNEAAMFEAGSEWERRSPYENLFMIFIILFFSFANHNCNFNCNRKTAQRGGDEQISFNTISRQLLSH